LQAPFCIARPENELAMKPDPAPPARPVSLIGAPTDVGAGSLGARLGPDALRIAGLAQALAAQTERVLDVADRGNLTGPPNPQQPAHDGHRHLDEVAAWCLAARDAVAAELALGRLPVLDVRNQTAGLVVDLVESLFGKSTLMRPR
jgi:arginase family enzyme